MKIVFFGTDYYSSLAMHSLIKQLGDKHEIAAVITNKSKASMPFAYTSPFEIAMENELTTINISSKQELLEQEEYLKSLNPDVGLVASFGYLIPKSVYEAPRHGTFNIHPSLLPKYRGVSPMQQAILDGLTETGVTLMKINEKFDTGPIIKQVSFSIALTDTTYNLAQKAFPLGITMFLEALDELANDNLIEKEQVGEASYTKSIKKDDAHIDFSEDIKVIDRKIRAFYPKPIAWAYLSELVKYFSPNQNVPSKWQEKRVLLLNSQLLNDTLQINKLQLEGKSPISWKQFASGYLTTP